MYSIESNLIAVVEALSSSLPRRDCFRSDKLNLGVSVVLIKIGHFYPRSKFLSFCLLYSEQYLFLFTGASDLLIITSK